MIPLATLVPVESIARNGTTCCHSLILRVQKGIAMDCDGLGLMSGAFLCSIGWVWVSGYHCVVHPLEIDNAGCCSKEGVSFHVTMKIPSFMHIHTISGLVKQNVTCSCEYFGLRVSVSGTNLAEFVLLKGAGNFRAGRTNKGRGRM